MAPVLWFASLALCCYNLAVTVRVLRNADCTGQQKMLQCLLTWLLPLFGALLVHGMLKAMAAPPRPRDAAFIPEAFIPEENIRDLPPNAP
jgi:uncharacterized membrane protein YhaH (DUF805 family)